MKVIELTGGVGAGKSRILELLRDRYGARILKADETARGLQKKGQPGYEKIVNAFGTGILGLDGELDREKLAALIFTDEAAREKINEIIHPLVWKQIHESVRTAREEGGALFVVETAVPDQNPDDIYDEVWYVYTLDDIRIRRLMESRGYSEKKALQIMESQYTKEQYLSLADHVIDNQGSLLELENQIKKLLYFLENTDKDFDL